MSFHLMVRQKVVLSLLIPLEWGPIIFIVAILPQIIFTLLPNHQLNILHRGCYGCVPFALQIYIPRTILPVPAQFPRCQQFLTSIADLIPTVRVGLMTFVGLGHNVDHRLQSNLKRTTVRNYN
jgi:hypothetical protein